MSNCSSCKCRGKIFHCYNCDNDYCNRCSVKYSERRYVGCPCCFEKKHNIVKTQSNQVSDDYYSDDIGFQYHKPSSKPIDYSIYYCCF